MSGLGDVTRLTIRQNSRTQFNLRAEGTSALTEAERDIALDPAEGEVDDRLARTLFGSRQLLRANATHSRPILGMSATLSGEIEHSEGRSLLGFPIMADGSPIVSDATEQSGMRLRDVPQVESVHRQLTGLIFGGTDGLDDDGTATPRGR